MNTESFKKPPCSEWKIWKGKEIEGKTSLGMWTLFVREGDPTELWEDFTRIWFTKEYTDWEIVRNAIDFALHVCIEATLETLPNIPKDIRDKAQIYLKLDVELKMLDHVCVGTPFDDEAFLIGHGQKVTPDQYLEDEKIL